MEYDTLEEAFGGGVGSGATVSDPEKKWIFPPLERVETPLQELHCAK